MKTAIAISFLAQACSIGNLGIVRMMLEIDLSLIRRRNADGFTPLHLAASQGHTSIVQALLLAGAKLETLTYEGETAASLAQNSGFDVLSQFLRTQHDREKVSGCDNIFRAAAAGRTTCLRRHIAERAVRIRRPDLLDSHGTSQGQALIASFGQLNTQGSC